jgi:hypothetical protein
MPHAQRQSCLETPSLPPAYGPEWFGPTVWNRDIGGENSADALLRVSDISALRPSTVFILFGTNDYLAVDQTESNLRPNSAPAPPRLRSSLRALGDQFSRMREAGGQSEVQLKWLASLYVGRMVRSDGSGLEYDFSL